MSSHFSEQQAAPAPNISTQLKRAGELLIPQSAKDSLVMMGFARSTRAKEASLTADGQLFVDMNDSSYAAVPRGRIAQVFTKALAGCTGIAGVAQTETGALAGVSHFDAMIDRFQRNGSASASEQFMYTFAAQARKQGAVAIELLVAYDKLSETAPEYGQRRGNYDTWYYLDQLETAAQYIGKDVSVSFNPYETGTSHSLAANVLPSSEVSIDFH